jgi:flagellar assembly factor FliW
MKIETQRFGVIELSEEEIISFPHGVIGFPKDKRFLLVPHNRSAYLAWLQSVDSSDLAFPVVSAHAFGERYPDVPIEPIVQSVGFGKPGDELAVMVVLSAPAGQPATVNLLAPVVVNTATRQGAQLILEGTRYTTRELFILQSTPEPVDATKPASATIG